MAVTPGASSPNGTRRVYVRGLRGGLGGRVVERLRELPSVEVVVASIDEPAPRDVGRCATIVDVGLADHDLLGRRGQSVTAEELLVDADTLDADQLVVVSSAMVYGALANNPIPLTEDSVLRPDPEFFSYTIAKSALWTATQTLAQALAPRIRVNAVAPGPVLPSDKQSEADFAAECRATLLKRGVAIDDVTAAIRFLLDTPSVTGQMIALDSGQHLAP